MFAEALNALLSLDLGWFIGITMHNLFWVFGFFVAAHIFKEGKNVLGYFLVITASVWMFFDFSNVTGWVVFGAFFLFVLYAGRMAVLMFIEDTEFGKKNLPLVYTMYFWVWMIIFNMFLK